MRRQEDSHIINETKARLRLWLGLLRLTSEIQSDLKRKLREEHDTTLPKFDVLSALSRYPSGLKMSQLSNFLRLSNGNLTGLVDRLTKDGFVLRVAVPEDRRAHMVRLTPAGQAFFSRVANDHEIWIGELLSAFSGEEADSLVEQIKNRGIET